MPSRRHNRSSAASRSRYLHIPEPCLPSFGVSTVTSKRRLGLAALAASLALLLAGCGGPAPTITRGPTRDLEILSWGASGSEPPAPNPLLDGFPPGPPGINRRDPAVAGRGRHTRHTRAGS